LFALLYKIKEETLTFTTTKKEILLGIGKKAKAGLAFSQKIKLPLNKIDKNQKWIPVPKRLIKALDFCTFSVSKDHSKPLLACIHVKGDKVESTDNFRISQYILDEKCPEFILPGDAVKHLKKLPVVKYCVGKSWVHFLTSDDAVFSCRIFNQVYPDTSRVTSISGKKMRFPEEIKEGVEKAVIFCEKEDGANNLMVDITLDKNSLTITGKGKVGWFKETTKARYVGERISFRINSKFLLDILEKTRICNIDYKAKKISFKTSEWIHLFLLLVE